MTQYPNLSSLQANAGQELGVSNWLEITQTMVNTFGEVTQDQQWIHTDPERARSDSPFGNTIAHGYLVLSLLPSMMRSVYSVEDAHMVINYGLNRVRFTSPVPVGTRIRARAVLARFEWVNSGARVTLGVTFEGEGMPKPVCIAEIVGLLYE